MEAAGVEEKLIMLTDTLQDVVNDISLRLDICKEEYRDAVKQIQELKKETKNLKCQVKELRSVEWDSRDRNIVIFGFKEEVNESKWDTYIRVIDLFTVVLQMDSMDHQIDNLFWTGKRKHNRSLLIKFTNILIKEYIMERKGMFKGYKVRLENDYSPDICAIRKKLVEFMWAERRRGKYAVLVGDQLRVEEAMFDLQYCEKNFKSGVGNTKRSESGRDTAPQGGKHDFGGTHKNLEKQKGREKMKRE